MYKRLELHNHTTESDANLTCLDLLDYMEADHVDAFALTDHNTISGHSKMKKLLENGNYKTQCIYGMEYTTYYGHILCFNLNEYVPWDSINYHKPELLFQAVKDKGGIAGIPHPFSFGFPFARGCRFEMTVKDYSKVDFIEVFNNPEPLHEVNEKGFFWWESLILDGHSLAATCGMDLHGKWKLEGQYATFIQGAPNGDISQELISAFQKKETWVSRGPLLLSTNPENAKSLDFSIEETSKSGGALKADTNYILSLRTKEGVLEKKINPESTLTISLDELPGYVPSNTIVIPRLYEENTTIENLVCLSPVITI